MGKPDRYDISLACAGEAASATFQSRESSRERVGGHNWFRAKETLARVFNRRTQALTDVPAIGHKILNNEGALVPRLIMPRIPLIDDLTRGSAPLGSNLLVEFDPASQWYNSCATIAAGWVKSGGDVGYNGFIQLPDNVRTQLTRLGLNVADLERNDRLRVYDWYTPTLGKKSREKYGIESLKVADQSIQFRLIEDDMNNPEELEWPESLRIVDNFSTLARFNDEKSWIEFMLTRVFPIAPVKKSTLVCGIMNGVHSEWAYKQLEGSADGIIEFRLDESGGKTIDALQIKTMRNVHFSREITELKLGDNFEVTLK